MRNVRGVLFLDYVRMLKAHKGVEWDAILAPEDAPYLKQQIDTTAWYPMSTFERMGNAILKFVAGDKMLPVQLWGRFSAAQLRDGERLRAELAAARVDHRDLHDRAARWRGRDAQARVDDELAGHRAVGDLEVTRA